MYKPIQSVAKYFAERKTMKQECTRLEDFDNCF